MPIDLTWVSHGKLPFCWWKMVKWGNFIWFNLILKVLPFILRCPCLDRKWCGHPNGGTLRHKSHAQSSEPSDKENGLVLEVIRIVRWVILICFVYYVWDRLTLPHDSILLLKLEQFYPWGIPSSIMAVKVVFLGAIRAIIWALGILLWMAWLTLGGVSSGGSVAEQPPVLWNVPQVVRASGWSVKALGFILFNHVS